MQPYKNELPELAKKVPDPGEPLLPEVIESSENAGNGAGFSDHDSLDRLKHALGPILPGILIDSLDFITFGHIGIFGGLFIGSLAGYWLASHYRMGMGKRLLGSLAVGIYCMLPFTSVLPLGTIIGAYYRFMDYAPPES